MSEVPKYEPTDDDRAITEVPKYEPTDAERAALDRQAQRHDDETAGIGIRLAKKRKKR